MREPHIVRDEVKEVVFGFYTDDDILKLSKCQVKSPIARDALGHSVSEGIYNIYNIIIIIIIIIILFIIYYYY